MGLCLGCAALLGSSGSGTFAVTEASSAREAPGIRGGGMACGNWAPGRTCSAAVCVVADKYASGPALGLARSEIISTCSRESGEMIC